MAYKSKGVDLANIVYGFGTSLFYQSFPTTVVNYHLKAGGVPVRMVPKNEKFMPFSDGDDIEGYKDNDSVILRASEFAGVNRFISSYATDRVTRTDPNSTPIYYRGNGYNGRGVLFIGGKGTAHRVSSDCPPVILIALQGGGGRGSWGLARGNAYQIGVQVWQHIGGNGGGAGGTAFLQVKMDHEATSPVLVGYFQVTNTGTYLRDSNNSAIAVAAVGGDGGSVSGTPSLWDASYSHSQGVGGTGGGVTVYSLSQRPEWKNVSFTSLTGEGAYNIRGSAGGKGGYNRGAVTNSVSDRYESSAGGGKHRTSVYINNAIAGNRIVGRSGGAGGINNYNGTTGYSGAGGGGGAGSMFGNGGTGNASPSVTAYGAGGGGGTPTKVNWTFLTGGDDWVSGREGTGGCVKFFW